MTNTTKILKELETTRARLKAVEAEKERMMQEWDIMPISEKLSLPYELRLMRKIEESEKQAKTEKIKIAILNNNYKIAFFAEILPAIIGTLEKYQGKAYGEKTRNKIRDELLHLTQCNIYFLAEEINIHKADNKGYNTPFRLTAYTKNRARILNESNKINAIPAESLRLYDVSEYIEDIPAALATMEELKARAVALAEELRKTCEEYNRFAVAGIDELNFRKL